MQNQNPQKTNQPSIEINPAIATDGKQALSQEIHAKWSKISEQDIKAFTGRDGLVDAVVAKYGLDKGQVQRDVDTLLNGRAL